MSETDSFQFRLQKAIKGSYEPYMRRSLQSITLYEANRCLESRYSQLRPFQKKFALFATAQELLKSLDFLDFFQRQEIMFRTIASKEPLAPDLAWRRMKLIEREIATSITTPYKAVIESDDNRGKSHDEVCDALLQHMYDQSREGTAGPSKPHHKEWEFSHNNVFTVYRIYYQGMDLDPDIYQSVPPKMVPVPQRKPSNFRVSASAIGINPNPAANLSDEDRRAMLKEVKDHTELLAAFVGVIPDEEITKRKRKLYAALPPVPLPAAGMLAPGKEKKRRKVRAVKAEPVVEQVKEEAAGDAAAAEEDPVATEVAPMEEEDLEKVDQDVEL